MSQTNTKICQDTRRGGEPSQGGSCKQCCSNRNGNRGNRIFANSLFIEKLENSCISSFSITKSGPGLNQLKKILDTLPNICQDKHYDYINDIVCTNTKPTQDYFLLNHPIKTQQSSMHYVKPESTNPIIRMDVPSDNSPIDTEMVENPPIFKGNLQEQS